MKRILAALLLLTLAAPAWGQDGYKGLQAYEQGYKGLQAYEQGDYAEAAKW